MDDRMEFRWHGPLSRIAYNASGGDRGRLFYANECKRLMTPYVPFRNGVLSQNVRVYVKDGCGVVHYLSPYAHYQYEGVLYVSSRNGSSWAQHGEYKIKAEPEKQLSHDSSRHPLATSHWDKAMFAARGEQLAQAYQRWLSSRGGGSNGGE